MVPKESLHWQQYLRAVALILAQHPPVLQLQHWMSWSIKTFHITPDISPEGGIVLAKHIYQACYLDQSIWKQSLDLVKYTSIWSALNRCRSARITQMSHFRFSHYPGERSTAGGIWEVPTAYWWLLWWLLWWLYLLVEPSSYRFRLSTNILEDHSKIVPWGLLDPKYLFPVFIIFPYRTRYCKHISYKDTILSIEGPQLRVILGRLVQ